MPKVFNWMRPFSWKFNMKKHMDIHKLDPWTKINTTLLGSTGGPAVALDVLSTYTSDTSIILASTPINVTDALATAFAAGTAVGNFKVTLYARVKFPV